MNYITNIWLIIIVFICITSCSYDQRSNIELNNKANDISIDSLQEETNHDIKERLEFSYSHLKKIIERNENRISMWRLELLTSDSTESISIQNDINQMENRVALQKERLWRLKSKDD